MMDAMRSPHFTHSRLSAQGLSLGGPRVLPAAEIAVVVDKFSRYGLKTR